jgi:hypothetical protein
VLDYSSLFTLLTFAGGEGSVFPGPVLDYFPKQWVGDSHVVHDSHLLILQFHASSFGAGLLGEVIPLFSVLHSIRRLSMS